MRALRCSNDVFREHKSGVGHAKRPDQARSVPLTIGAARALEKHAQRQEN
jgi:hypothetical protein